ncbi:MAG: lysophospholipid acyltransferase family protein [Calditrichaeota bacterium]|nr:lysophospholipid acyltransferase family protein [Calditrichota bacterium]
MSNSKQLRNVLEFLGLKFIWLTTQILPYWLAVRLSRVLSFLAFSIFRVRRDVTLQNLQRAFPEKSARACTQLAKKVYDHFGRVAMDFLYLSRLIPKKIMQLVVFENETVLRDALKQGKGVVLNGGHLGNWEFMAAIVPLKGYPTSIIVGTQRNSLADEWINSNRLLAGSKIIHVGGAVRKSLKALGQGECVALLSDQDAGKDGQFVPFFGRKASAPVGAALLALKSGAPMIYSQTVWKNGRYVVEFKEIPTRDLDGPTPENLWELTRRFTETLEENIRKYPDQWFWMHRRWKTRPPGESERVSR